MRTHGHREGTSHTGACWGWGDWRRIALGEIPNVDDGGWMQQTTMACVYLGDNPL